MADDLVKRLRGNHDDISHEDIYESADRIEQDAQHIDEMYALVAAMNADHTASKTRIEKLETALREPTLPMLLAGKKSLYSCSEDPEIEDARACFLAMARKALEGKDD